MAQTLYLLGFAGTIIVAFGYLPQITHLIGERCARGVSIKAWGLWSLASLLIFLYAVHLGDWIIVTLSAVQMTASITITALAISYQGTRCPLCRRHEEDNG